jgi:protein TonB
MNYLGENISFPNEDKIEGLSGEVVVSFLVDHDGKVKEPRVEVPQSPTMNSECVRLVKMMPDWMPRSEHNRNIATRYFLPIRFTNVSYRGQRWMKRKAKGLQE